MSTYIKHQNLYYSVIFNIMLFIYYKYIIYSKIILFFYTNAIYYIYYNKL